MVRTGVDTCIFFDIISGEPAVNVAATDALRRAGRAGQLAISVVTYAELAVAFRSVANLDLFLMRFQVKVVALDQGTAFAAGQLYHAYKLRGGTRTRIIADFLIGAHAQNYADRLLTRDNRFFGDSFPGLKAVAPADI
jgi:predicted nucleic acid-binding protein